MLMHLSFGLLLLAVSVSGAPDYYLTTTRTTDGKLLFNFDDYARATSPDEKKERGINVATQTVIDYMNTQYQVIKAADPNSPLPDQLAWTARALVGGPGDIADNGPTLSEKGLAAKDTLKRILEQQAEDFRATGEIQPESMLLVNYNLAILNAEVNEINGDSQRDRQALTYTLAVLNADVNEINDQAAVQQSESGSRTNSEQTTMEIGEASSLASENPGWLAKLRTILQAITEFFGFERVSATDESPEYYPICRRSNRRMLLEACSLGGNEETMTVTGTDTSDQIVTAGGETKGAESDGTSTGGIETGGIDVSGGGIETGGITTGGIETGGIETGGIEAGGIETGGISTGGREHIIETGPSGAESVVEAI